MNAELDEIAVNICKDDETNEHEKTSVGVCLAALKNEVSYDYTDDMPYQIEELLTVKDKNLDEEKNVEIIDKFVPIHGINKMLCENQENFVELDQEISVENAIKKDETKNESFNLLQENKIENKVSIDLIQSDKILLQLEDQLPENEFAQNKINIAESNNSSTQIIYGNKNLRKSLEITIENNNRESFANYLQSNRNSIASNKKNIMGVGIKKDSDKIPASRYKDMISPRKNNLISCKSTKQSISNYPSFRFNKETSIFPKIVEETHEVNPFKHISEKNDNSRLDNLNNEYNADNDLSVIKKLEKNNLLDQEKINIELNKVIKIQKNKLITNDEEIKEKNKNINDFDINQKNISNFEIKNFNSEEESLKKNINETEEKCKIQKNDFDLSHKIKQDCEKSFQNNAVYIRSNPKNIINKMDDDLSKFSTGSSLNLAENYSSTFEINNLESTINLNETDLKIENIKKSLETPKSSKLGNLFKKKISEAKTENVKQEITTKNNKKTKKYTTINTENTVEIKESAIQQVTEILEESPIFRIKNFYFKFLENCENKKINKYSESYLMQFKDVCILNNY